ncbi:hypothetical protein MRX96_022703 [Rhipicephalus microplus]
MFMISNVCDQSRKVVPVITSDFNPHRRFQSFIYCILPVIKTVLSGRNKTRRVLTWLFAVLLDVTASPRAGVVPRARSLSPVLANGTLPKRRQRRRHCMTPALRASALVAARSPHGQHGRTPHRCSRSWCVKPAPRSAPFEVQQPSRWNHVCLRRCARLVVVDSFATVLTSSGSVTLISDRRLAHRAISDVRR